MISIHIPKGNKGYDIQKEISSAKRIKDRKTKQSTLDGLYKINHYL